MFKGVAFCALLSCALASYDFASYYGFEMPEASKTAPVELPAPAAASAAQPQQPATPAEQPQSAALTQPAPAAPEAATPAAAPVEQLQSAPAPAAPIKEDLKQAPAPQPKQLPIFTVHPIRVPVYQYKAPSKCVKKELPVYKAPAKVAPAPAPKKEEVKPVLKKEEIKTPVVKKEEVPVKAVKKEALTAAPAPIENKEAATGVYKKEASAPPLVLQEAPAEAKEAFADSKKEVVELGNKQESAPAVQEKEDLAEPFKYGKFDYYAPPKYQFKYELDGFPGDKQFHQEERDGDSTKGKYELKNPHGLLTFDYTVVSKH